MGSLSDYAEGKILDHVFNASFSAVTNVYLALCTADPTDAGTGASCNEAADTGGYARTAISFGNAASRVVTQNADVDFAEASGAWGNITHWAIVDSITHGAGNMWAHGAFTTTYAPVSGNTPTVPSGDVNVTFSATSGNGGFTTYLVNEMLDHIFNAAAFTTTSGSTFLALLNATSSDAATTMAGQTEVAGTGYARKEVNENGGASPTWDLAASSVVDNTHDVTFATVGAGGWSNIVAVAVVDAVSGTSANVLCYDNDVVDQTSVVESDIVKFVAGAFDVTLA